MTHQIWLVFKAPDDWFKILICSESYLLFHHSSKLFFEPLLSFPVGSFVLNESLSLACLPYPMSACPNPSSPLIHRLSANSSTGLLLMTLARTLTWAFIMVSLHNRFCPALCLNYSCMYLSLHATMLELPYSPIHVVISSTLGCQLNDHFLRIRLRITWGGQISVLLSAIALCTCSWHLSQLQFTFSCMVISFMSASPSRPLSVMKASCHGSFPCQCACS